MEIITHTAIGKKFVMAVRYKLDMAVKKIIEMDAVEMGNHWHI